MMQTATYLHLFLLLWLIAVPTTSARRYLLYSVNPGEGFNLRRDVHMRVATLVKDLRQKEDWVLVLPPWPHLYHWKSRDIAQNNVKWERFFDLLSLNEYVPSIEFEDYLSAEGRFIDTVLYLQNFAEGWGGKWEEKMEDRPCIHPPKYRQSSSGNWKGYIFGHDYDDVVVKSFQCVSIQGFTKILVERLHRSKAKSVLVERFETLIHNQFGNYDYWSARNSMVYAKPLRDVGNQLMRNILKYDPGDGNGRREPKNGGGEFLSVHVRRQDYLQTRKGKLPSLEGVAKQITVLKHELGISKVFLATDAPKQEKQEISKKVGGDVVWFTPSKEQLHRYGDGGVAIIDQWIAAHAKYFTGTVESTFTYRIREDRLLMGFSKESTFNRLCGPDTDEKDPHSCGRPGYWKINEQLQQELKNLEHSRVHDDL